MIPLPWYLLLAAALFCIGAYGVLSRRNGIVILMGIELMLNGANINLVAFWRYLEPGGGDRAGICAVRLRRRRSRGGGGIGAHHCLMAHPRHSHLGRR